MKASNISEEKEFDNLMLDIAQKNLDRVYNRFKDIDTKAVGVIGSAGILIAFISRLDEPDDGVCAISKNFMYFLMLVSFLITILLSVYVIMIRKYKLPSTDNIIKDAVYDEKYKKTLIGTYKKSESELIEETNKKANILKYSIFMLVSSIILLIIYSTR